MRSKKLLLRLGYVAFAVFSLLASLYFTFPADVVGQRIAQEVHRQSRGRVALRFADVALYRFSGIEAEGVQVQIRRDGKVEPLRFQVDELTARVALLPLVLLRVTVEASLEAGDGTIDLSYSHKGDDGFGATVAIESLNLSSPAILPQLAGVPLGGIVDGELEVAWAKEVRESEGNLSLRLQGASAGPGSLSGFGLPRVGLGTLNLTAELKTGRFEVLSFEQTAGDLAAKLSASANLRASINSSSMDVCMQVKPSEKLLNDNPKLKTALDLASQVQFRKDNDGALHIPVGGTIGRPRVRRNTLCRKRPTASKRPKNR